MNETETRVINYQSLKYRVQCSILDFECPCALKVVLPSGHHSSSLKISYTNYPQFFPPSLFLSFHNLTCLESKKTENGWADSLYLTLTKRRSLLCQMSPCYCTFQVSFKIPAGKPLINNDLDLNLLPSWLTFKGCNNFSIPKISVRR